jgi:hypothetical protein
MTDVRAALAEKGDDQALIWLEWAPSHQTYVLTGLK